MLVRLAVKIIVAAVASIHVRYDARPRTRPAITIVGKHAGSSAIVATAPYAAYAAPSKGGVGEGPLCIRLAVILIVAAVAICPRGYTISTPVANPHLTPRIARSNAPPIRAIILGPVAVAVTIRGILSGSTRGGGGGLDTNTRADPHR